jgi:hypothetical protein
MTDERSLQFRPYFTLAHLRLLPDLWVLVAPAQRCWPRWGELGAGFLSSRPPFSSDLNLIEHLWHLMETWLQKNQPNLSYGDKSGEQKDSLIPIKEMTLV